MWHWTCCPLEQCQIFVPLDIYKSIEWFFLWERLFRQHRLFTCLMYERKEENKTQLWIINIWLIIFMNSLVQWVQNTNPAPQVAEIRTPQWPDNFSSPFVCWLISIKKGNDPTWSGVFSPLTLLSGMPKGLRSHKYWSGRWRSEWLWMI